MLLPSFTQYYAQNGINGSMIKFIHRIRLRIQDYFIANGWARLSSSARYFLSCAGLQRSRQLEFLADRCVAFEAPPSMVTRGLKLSKKSTSRLVSASTHDKNKIELNYSIIAKPHIGDGERGILVVSFERELLKIVSSPYFEAIENKYAIAFIPSWQPFHSEAFFGLASRATRDYFVLASTRNDAKHLSAFGPLANYVPLSAASWVNKDLYSDPLPFDQRDIDIVMLANFSIYKRHWRLFEALRDIPHSRKVLLMGVPMDGRDDQTLMKEAGLFGVQDRFEILQNAPDDVVVNRIRRSKLFAALSLREGSFVAVAEALIAGVPVALFSDALIGTKSLLSSINGFFLDRRKQLAHQLEDAISATSSLDPKSISQSLPDARMSSQLLNEMLREHALQQGQPWTQDLKPFFAKRFWFYYFDRDLEHVFSKEHEEFASEFQLIVRRM